MAHLPFRLILTKYTDFGNIVQINRKALGYAQAIQFIHNLLFSNGVIVEKLSKGVLLEYTGKYLIMDAKGNIKALLTVKSEVT